MRYVLITFHWSRALKPDFPPKKKKIAYTTEGHLGRGIGVCIMSGNALGGYLQ